MDDSSKIASLANVVLPFLKKLPRDEYELDIHLQEKVGMLGKDELNLIMEIKSGIDSMDKLALESGSKSTISENSEYGKIVKSYLVKIIDWNGISKKKNFNSNDMKLSFDDITERYYTAKSFLRSMTLVNYTREIMDYLKISPLEINLPEEEKNKIRETFLTSLQKQRQISESFASPNEKENFKLVDEETYDKSNIRAQYEKLRELVISPFPRPIPADKIIPLYMKLTSQLSISDADRELIKPVFDVLNYFKENKISYRDEIPRSGEVFPTIVESISSLDIYLEK